MLVRFCCIIMKASIIINAELLTGEVLTPMWVRLFGTSNGEYPLCAYVFIFSVN